jgi:WD40 repeat protein
MNTASAALVALLALPSAVTANPSLQAGSLVFVKRKNVYAYDVTTRVVTQLTHRGDAAGDVALAPDGKSVAYTASVARGTDIRVVALDGSGARDVTPWISPRLGAPLHTHVNPGWLSANRLVYVDDQRAASAAVGRLQAVDLRTGAHGAVGGLPRALRSFVFEPVRVSPAGIAYTSLVFVAGGSHCEATEDLWLWRGQTTRLSRTPQAWESPLDVEPGLPVLGLRGKFVSGPHSGGCSYGKTTVAYEIRAFGSRSSKRLVRFTPTSRFSQPAAAWSSDGSLLAVVTGGGRLSVLDLSTRMTTQVTTGVSAVDW